MWVDQNGTELFLNNNDDQISMKLPGFTRVTVHTEAEDRKKRFHVEVGKGPQGGPTQNRSIFEAANERAMGWVDPHSLRDEFPRGDLFEIPDCLSVIPRLYHGSDKAAILSIMAGAFTVSTNPNVGRSFGDAVYATPYISQAAVHAFGATAHAHKPTFAVASVYSKVAAPAMREPRILVHDMIKADEIAGALQGTGTIKQQAYAVFDRMHGTKIAQTADKLADAVPGNHAATVAELTAAARVHNYDTVLYKGGPGLNIYCLLRISDWKAEAIVFEEQVALAVNERGLEDLDWYHRVTLMDYEQDFRNRHGRW